MGLTIHYTLKSKSRSSKRIGELVEKLRQRALDMPFDHVGNEVVYYGPDVCTQDIEKYRGNDDIFSTLCFSSQYIDVPWGKKRGMSVSVYPTEIYSFWINPGPGCESAKFGFARYPSTVELVYQPKNDDRYTRKIKDDRSDRMTRYEFDYGKWDRHCRRNGKEYLSYLNEDLHERRTIRTGLGSTWRMRDFCKTQYASDPNYGGVPNFLRCHLGVIRMLDYAKELGIEVSIDDEGHFETAHYTDDWKVPNPHYYLHDATRDVKELLSQLGDYNTMIAGLGGMLKDMAGNDNELEAPILGYPNFEHLEADFHAKAVKDADMKRLIENMAKLAFQPTHH